MSEQLAFEEPFGHGSTVHWHKGLALPGASKVQGTRHETFTNAAISLNQDSATGRYQTFQEGKQALHDSALPKQLAEGVALLHGLAQLAIFPPQLTLGERLTHQRT